MCTKIFDNKINYSKEVSFIVKNVLNYNITFKYQNEL